MAASFHQTKCGRPDAMHAADSYRKSAPNDTSAAPIKLSAFGSAIVSRETQCDVSALSLRKFMKLCLRKKN